MENVFEQIELINVENIEIQSLQNKKDSSALKTKERHSSNRPGVDYQQVKKRNDCLKQTEQLKNNIREMVNKNQLIYERIIKTSPDFAGVLFSPKFYNQTLKIANFDEAKMYEHKLLLELDKLYEQNCLLEKQLNRAKFIEQHEQKQKQDNLLIKVNHYQFLRNIWQQNKNDEKLTSINDGPFTTKSQDFIERLNKKVGIVKLGINRILKEQQSSQQSNSLSQQIQDDFIEKSSKYQKLLRLYEQTMMKLQQQNGFIQQKLLKKQQNSKISDENAQIQNLRLKLKDLQFQISKKQEKLLIKEKQLEILTKKQDNLRYVFTSEEDKFDHQFCIKIYSKDQPQLYTNKQVENYQIQSKLSDILDQLLQSSQKVSNFLTLPNLDKTIKNHKRSLTDRKVVSQFSLDQIQKDRINLIRKTNILTQNLSQNNTAKRNFSKQKFIQKTPQIDQKQKENIVIGGFQSFPRDQNSTIDFPNFSVGLTSAQTKTKFVRSSNRHR